MKNTAGAFEVIKQLANNKNRPSSDRLSRRRASRVLKVTPSTALEAKL